MSFSALTVFPLAATGLAAKVMLSDLTSRVWISRSLVEDEGAEVDAALERADGKPIEINVKTWKVEQENWE